MISTKRRIQTFFLSALLSAIHPQASTRIPNPYHTVEATIRIFHVVEHKQAGGRGVIKMDVNSPGGQ